MSEHAWHSVTQARRSLPEFGLPTAIALDPTAPHPHHPPPPDWQAMRALLCHAGADRQARVRLVEQIEQSLAHWPAGRSETERSATAIDTPTTHDDYFCVARTTGDTTVAYVGGIGRALALFVDEVDATGELPDYLGIGETLIGLWAQAWPGSGPEGFNVLADLARAPGDASPLLQRAADPLRRWLRGHQIFAALTQGMVWSLAHLPAALEQDDGEDTEQVLLSLTALYRASAAAFRFTAEFDPQVYAEVLRPTMCEPYMPKGFSGTLSSDHGVLVARLTMLREQLALARQRRPDAYAQMRAALGAVYDNHRWVCERFDGANVPSLRTSSVSGETSAVEMLDRFRTRRLEMLR